MKRTSICSRVVIGAALVSSLVPSAAFAASEGYETAITVDSAIARADTHGNGLEDAPGSSSLLASIQASLSEAKKTPDAEAGSLAAPAEDDAGGNRRVQAVISQVSRVSKAQAEATDKLLSYDPAAIASIGTQESTGHTICCPSFSCAYADAVLDGTVHDHSYYVCSNCRWTDWGGGNSSFRCVGGDEQLLREAYDQIAAGKPTVIHVRASFGEHWIALIGYTGANDPDHLALSNFIALDPWDGAQINAADRFVLYGDGCEHVSER